MFNLFDIFDNNENQQDSLPQKKQTQGQTNRNKSKPRASQKTNQENIPDLQSNKFQSLSTNIFLNGPYNDMPMSPPKEKPIQDKPKDTGTFGALATKEELKYQDPSFDYDEELFGPKPAPKKRGKSKALQAKNNETKKPEPKEAQKDGYRDEKSCLFKASDFKGKAGQNCVRQNLKQKYGEKSFGTTAYYKSKF